MNLDVTVVVIRQEMKVKRLRNCFGVEWAMGDSRVCDGNGNGNVRTAVVWVLREMLPPRTHKLIDGG